MRDLSAQVGIGADPNYLNGELVDNQTLVGEGINQDLVQFFQKIADLAGTVFNGLPDNETNGYQLVEALETVVRTFQASTTLKGVVEKATVTEAQTFVVDKFIDASTLQSVTATTDRVGLVEKATPSETQNGQVDKYPDAKELYDLRAGLLPAIIDIGDWQMTVTPSVDVAHGLPDVNKIRRVTAMIRNDLSGVLHDIYVKDPIFGDGGSIARIDGTNITLNRVQNGFFDNINFDASGYNRGWLVVEFLP